MKSENIPADIKSKSLKEARDEIDVILRKLENQGTNLEQSITDYQRLILLNKHIDILFKQKFVECKYLTAYVKFKNIPSIKLFNNYGFQILNKKKQFLTLIFSFYK